MDVVLGVVDAHTGRGSIGRGGSDGSTAVVVTPRTSGRRLLAGSKACTPSISSSIGLHWSKASAIISATPRACPRGSTVVSTAVAITGRRTTGERFAAHAPPIGAAPFSGAISVFKRNTGPSTRVRVAISFPLRLRITQALTPVGSSMVSWGRHAKTVSMGQLEVVGPLGRPSVPLARAPTLGGGVCPAADAFASRHAIPGCKPVANSPTEEGLS